MVLVLDTVTSGLPTNCSAPASDCKWPSLTELHCHLFGTPFEDARRALPFADAWRRCFVRVRELGVLAD